VPTIFIIPLCLSFLLGLITIFTLRWHGSASFDLGKTVQAVHDAPTPRVGGVSIFLAIIFTFLVAHYFWSSSETANNLLLPEALNVLAGMLISVTPIFLIGVVEDLTKRISVKVRLWISLASGVLGCLVLGNAITTLDFYYLDLLLAIPLVASIFTAFSSAGVANAINMIDGLNGLALLVVLQMLSGAGLLAYLYGDFLLIDVVIVFAGAIAGLLFLNWPFGKIFLGDGGAYLAGFFVAWVCILLNERNPLISAYACLMLCAYPITEVIYSSWRRVRARTTTGKADSLHLHQLVYRGVVCRFFKTAPPVLNNSIAGLLCSLLATPAVVFAVIYHSSKIALIGGFFAYIALYVLTYKMLLPLEVKP
jgi:UDP-N-acetylmuramyl pentapeptide phosphotransferase/UDP-N-acetylglucosamine-1-phosphate transferase